MKINELLLIKRKKRKLTQQTIANDLSINIRLYQKWEKGDIIPDGKNIIKIIKYFNLDKDEIYKLFG